MGHYARKQPYFRVFCRYKNKKREKYTLSLLVNNFCSFLIIVILIKTKAYYGTLPCI
jgi:hypothetical protein